MSPNAISNGVGKASVSARSTSSASALVVAASIAWRSTRNPKARKLARCSSVTMVWL